MSIVKRLFLYVVTGVTLGIFAQGCTILLGLLFDIPGDAAEWRDPIQGNLALGLAMLIIGGVLWFVFWRIIQNATKGNTTEQGSGIRKLYLNAILVISSIMVLSSFSEFFGWAIGGTPYDDVPSLTLSTLIIGAGLWWYHNRVERNEGQPSWVARVLHRWYIYFLSAFGLVSVVFNLIQIINVSVVYLLPEGESTVQGGLWHGVMAYHITWIISGGLAWWYFWFRKAKGDYDSTLRQVYLYLLPVTSSVVAALTALSTLLYRFLGLAFNGAAEFDFTFIGWTVPTAVICGGVWYYHRQLVEEESVHLNLNKQSPRRFYRYLMSFIGLGTMLSGIVYLIAVVLGVLFDSVSTASVFADNWWSNQLSLALSLLLAGVPVWLYFWRSVLRMTGEGGVTERSSRSRRIYVYTVLGLSLIAAVTTLVIVIYQIINGILLGEFGREFFNNVTWSLSVLLTSIPVLIYHWKLLREDQELGAEKLIRKKRVNVVAGADAGDLIRKLEENLGYSVRKLRYTGEAAGQLPALTDEEVAQVCAKVAEADGEGVIIDLTGTTLKILPYEDD